MKLCDVNIDFGHRKWRSDAEPATCDRLVQMTHVFSYKIRRPLRAAKIAANGVGYLMVIPTDRRRPQPPERRADFILLDMPVDWAHFRAIEADGDEFRDLICDATLRTFEQIGPEWGLPVAQLCSFVEQVAAEPYVLEQTYASCRVPGSKMKIRLDTRLDAWDFQLFLVAETGGKDIWREKILETPTHPDFWYHEFKALSVDNETITVTRRIGIDRPLFTCRVPQNLSGAE